MTPYILAALVLWIVQTVLPPSIRYLRDERPVVDRMKAGLGNRDQQPELGVFGERARRALLNYGEAMPVFLALALLLQIEGITTPLATGGALGFVILRTLYVPAYVFGVFGVRSLLWTCGAGCMGAMALALVG